VGFVPTGHRPIKSRHFYQAGDNIYYQATQSQSALHSTWNGEQRTYFLRKKKSSVSINAEKTNNAPNYVERFKVPMVLMVIFNM
jgi:hypothetical protein